MGKFSRVRYLRVSRISLEIVNGLSDREKAMFLNQVLSWFSMLERKEEIEFVDTGNVLLNLALQEEIAELQDGFTTYMKAVNAKSGSDIGDVSAINHPNITDASQGHPSDNQSESITNLIDNNQINQIRCELKKAGYSDSEIDKALSHKTNTTISNPIKYIQKIIENDRKQKPKPTTAQFYSQRDYSGEDADALQRMLNLGNK